MSAPMWLCKPCSAAHSWTSVIYHPMDEPCPNDAMSVSFDEDES